MVKYTIHINGIIGKDFKYSDLLTHLAAAKDAEIIDLVFDSVGGYVDEGLLMYKLLNESEKNISCVNSGNVCSIASIIWLTGKKRVFHPERGIFLIHNPWVEMVSGDAKTLIEISKELKTIENDLSLIYQKHTGAALNIIKQFMSIDTPFTPEQIEIFKLAEVSQTTELKAVAMISNKNKNKMTESKKDEKKETSILDKLEGILNTFSKKQIKAVVLQDVNGVEFDFIEVSTESEIATGTKVTQGGSDYSGEIVLPSGITYVSENGEITRMSEVDNKIETLEAENKELETQNKILAEKIEALKVENDEKIKDYMNSFMALKKEHENYIKGNAPDQPVAQTPPKAESNELSFTNPYKKK